MHFHCAGNVDFSKAKKIADYFTGKLFRKYKKLDSHNVSVWVKEVNPKHSAGVEKFKCRVNLHTNRRDYYAEFEGPELNSVIKHPIESIANKVHREMFNQKNLRMFKRSEIAQKVKESRRDD